MRRFIVRRAYLLDSWLLTPRAADDKEWRASAPGAFMDNLRWSIGRCNMDGETICVWDTETKSPLLIGGAMPQQDGSIHTWLVVAEGGEAWGLTLMKDYKADLDAFFARWPKTECFSDSRNTVHHRWLMYLGYELVEEIEWGHLQLPFKHFRRGF